MSQDRARIHPHVSSATGVAAPPGGVTRGTTFYIRAPPTRASRQPSIEVLAGLSHPAQAGHRKGGSMEPRVMAYSQTYRLRERMAEAAIGHGQEVRADLPGIRVTDGIADWRSAPDPNVGAIFFCNWSQNRPK